MGGGVVGGVVGGEVGGEVGGVVGGEVGGAVVRESRDGGWIGEFAELIPHSWIRISLPSLAV